MSIQIQDIYQPCCSYDISITSETPLLNKNLNEIDNYLKADEEEQNDENLPASKYNLKNQNNEKENVPNEGE